MLVEAWEQCKDADVLVESPPAMAGVHIAEALSMSPITKFRRPLILLQISPTSVPLRCHGPERHNIPTHSSAHQSKNLHVLMSHRKHNNARNSPTTDTDCYPPATFYLTMFSGSVRLDRSIGGERSVLDCVQRIWDIWLRQKSRSCTIFHLYVIAAFSLV